MTPKERNLSARIRPEIDDIIMEESAALGISKTEYIERLVEGTLPSKLEKLIREVGSEIVDNVLKGIKKK